MHLGAEDLLNPHGDVARPATTGARGQKLALAASAAAQMLLDRLAGDLRDRDSAALGLVSEAGIQVIGQFHRCKIGRAHV